MRGIGGRIWTKLAVTVTAALLLAPVAGAAGQMDASDSPEVTGELDLRTESCQTENEKHEGEVVARGKTCLRIYAYDPGAENDTERNYGVAWLQSNVNSRLGWCAAKVTADIDLPENFDLEAYAPHSLDIRRKRTYETTLQPDAGGNASGTAQETSISQSQILYPRSLSTWLRADTNVLRLVWRGSRDAKLGFAFGAEVSWPSGAEPDPLSYRLRYQLERARC